ncbi:hypothetical protein PV797_08755 [Clostridiaceae bacterium M8S5]|nr:hypothetical protein PV797_08755 [Clostridiaceae bacterium M8S5]
MKSVTDQLFDGEISAEDMFILTDEYREANDIYDDTEKYLTRLLDKDTKKIYYETIDKKSITAMIESKIYFSQGFKLGFRLAKEMLEDS